MARRPLTGKPATLPGALAAEVERVALLAADYRVLPIESQLVLHLYIDPALNAARDAIGTGDVVAMLSAYAALKRIVE